jgi:toluene monooxygenase system protein A
MTMLKREDWQDIVRDVEWDFTHVDYEAVFPDWQCGPGKIPREAWKQWEESYKVTYPHYVAIQQEKEAAAYAVKAAIQRSNTFASLDEGWKSSTKMHYGGVALAESIGEFGELRMARFGLSSAWRNMAVFGVLDEIRHAQITLFCAHEFVSKDAQYDWAKKAYHTNDWVSIALRTLFDGMIGAPGIVDMAIQLPLMFETGFTNLQFVAMSADALESGDISFANMISSIQTDEARHAQQGGPTLEILMEHDPARAQWVVDKYFWLSARAFSALTGPGMDYYTPLEHRRQSYRQFMEEWIIDQFSRTLADYGLKRPWYWDEFMEGLDTWHHSLHLGLWFWRPTTWWKPVAGIGREERAWLQEHYPNFETIYGPLWDTIIQNVNNGQIEKTLPATLPWICNTCHLPNANPTFGRDGKWRLRDWSLSHDGVKYHFCSNTCRQLWWKDRDWLNSKTILDRFLAGEIQPMDLGGALQYMGITPEIAGDDGHNYEWAKEYLPGHQQPVTAGV